MRLTVTAGVIAALFAGGGYLLLTADRLNLLCEIDISPGTSGTQSPPSYLGEMSPGDVVYVSLADLPVKVRVTDRAMFVLVVKSGSIKGFRKSGPLDRHVYPIVAVSSDGTNRPFVRIYTCNTRYQFPKRGLLPYLQSQLHDAEIPRDGTQPQSD